MPKRKTLQDRIRQSSGQLASTSVEEMSKQAGRPIQPLSPQAGAMIGANPHQSKMLGSGAQKTSTLRQALSGQDDLATVQRREQASRTQTQQQQAQQQKAQQFENLSQFGDVVESRAQENIATGLSEADPAQVATGALEQLAADPTNQDLMLQAAQELGLDPTKFQSGEQIMQAFGFVQDGVGGWEPGPDSLNKVAAKARSVAEGVSFQLTPEDITSLGFSGDQELAETLGVSVEELSVMGPTEISQRAQEELNKQFSEVENLQNQANDPNLGPAERAEFRKQLKDMGAVGVRSVESDMDTLADEIADDNMISFAGQEMTVEQFLTGDEAEGIVAKYLEDPNSEFAKDIKANSPELSAFIERNKKALEELAADVEPAAKEFAETQNYNKTLNTIDEQQLPPGFIEAAVPGYGGLSAEKLAIQSPILAELKTGTLSKPGYEEQRKNISNVINKFSELYPGQESELASLPLEKLAELGLTNGSPESANKIITHLENKKAYESLVEDPSRDKVLDFLGITGEQALDLARKKSSGLVPGMDQIPFTINPQTGALDMDRAFEILDQSYRPELSELNTGILDLKSQISEAVNTAPPANDTYQLFSEELQDGTLSSQDVSGKASSLSMEQFNQLLESPEFRDKLDTDAKDSLNFAFKKKIRDEITGPAYENTSIKTSNQAVKALASPSRGFYQAGRANKTLEDINTVTVELESRLEQLPEGSAQRRLVQKEIVEMKAAADTFRTQQEAFIKRDRQEFLDKGFTLKQYNVREKMRREGRLTPEIDRAGGPYTWSGDPKRSRNYFERGARKVSDSAPGQIVKDIATLPGKALKTLLRR